MDWSAFFRFDIYAYCWSLRGSEQMAEYGISATVDDCIVAEMGWMSVVHLVLIIGLGLLVQGLRTGDWSLRE